MYFTHTVVPAAVPRVIAQGLGAHRRAQAARSAGSGLLRTRLACMPVARVAQNLYTGLYYLSLDGRCRRAEESIREQIIHAQRSALQRSQCTAEHCKRVGNILVREGEG